MTKLIASEIAAWLKGKFSEVELVREQMHGYQETGLDFLKKNPFSALFIDMGLGKTVTSATLIADLLADLDFEGKVLIIGPLRVATRTWPDEFRKWKHLAHLNLSVIHVDDDDPRLKEAARRGREAGRAGCTGLFQSERAKAAQQGATRAVAAEREKIRAEATLNSASVHVISADWLEWLVAYWHPQLGRKWPYRVVFIDESSGFKDHNSGRFKALQAVRDTPGAITRLHLLTATPAAESYIGLFPQIYLLDRGARLGRNITAYRDRYFKENKYSRKWILQTGAEKEIVAKISDICLVMKERDYLPREEPLFVTRNVDMNQAQRALYTTMAEKMVVTLDDGSEITADTAAALSAKLLQMASGVLYETQLLPGQTDEDDHVKIKKVHNIHTHKLEELDQIIAEAQGKPILVGYHHRASKDRLKQRYGEKITFMDSDGKCVKPWNSGKIPILAMHPQSGGHGLNLQAGGHIIVWYDIPWSLELYLQFIGRLARQGQKYRVTVFLLVCRGTLDETVTAALTAKEDAQDILFRLLKRMRKKLRKLLKGRKASAPGDAAWDEVVEILTDSSAVSDDEDDEPLTAQQLVDNYGLDPVDAMLTAQAEREEWAHRNDHCPTCGDIGGPCGPGSDCYDEL